MKQPQQEKIRNPGTFLNLTDKCKNIFPLFFDGFNVTINRALSPHFKVSHAIYMSSITPGNYRLGVTYVGGKMVSPYEGVPVITGDIDSSGNMNASIYHLFGNRLRVRFDGQMANRSFTTSQLSTHYFGNTYTASALLVNPDFIRSSGGMMLQYLQNVTHSMAFGVEFAYLHNMVNPLRKYLRPGAPRKCSGSQVAVVARYTTQHSMWGVHVSLHNVLLSCFKQASEQLEFGIELDTNFRLNQTVGTLAYKVTLKERGVVFRGSLDTDSNVGSVFEKNIFDSPFAFSLSSNMNYRTNNFRLGFGITVN